MKHLSCFFILIMLINGCALSEISQLNKQKTVSPCWIKTPYCYEKNNYRFLAVGTSQNGDVEKAKNMALKELSSQLDTQIIINNIVQKKYKKDKKKYIYYVKTKDEKTRFITNIKINTIKLEEYKSQNSYYVLYGIDERKTTMYTLYAELKTTLDFLLKSPLCNKNDFCEAQLQIVKHNLSEVDFDFLKLHGLLGKDDNYAIYEAKIREIESHISHMKRIYNLPTEKKQEKKENSVIQLNKQLLSLCTDLEERFDIDLDIKDSRCKVFLDKNSICKNFCGGLPFIRIDQGISNESLSKLLQISSIKDLIRPLYELKSDIRAIEYSLQEKEE